MLIDILRMPPVFGIPISRRRTIMNDASFLPGDPNTVIWQGLPLFNGRLNVGADIAVAPKQVYKAVHVSSDFKHAFETVFSMEDAGAVCLYTKVVNSTGSRMGVSVNAVRFYNQHRNSLVPLSHFLIGNRLPGVNSFVDTPLVRTNPIENIVPPILDLKTLWTAFATTLEIGPESMDMRLAAAYHPLYIHLPNVLEALLSGMFVRNPFQEFLEEHPSIKIPHDRWFSWEKVNFAVQAKGMMLHVNHPAFDEQVSNIMALSPAQFQISALLSHAVDELSDVWLTSHYDDVYHPITMLTFSDQKPWIKSILKECTMIYCRMFMLDYETFMDTSNDKSSITISKNTYDEIEINIHDMVSDRYVCFYTSFPALALTTLSVGWNG